MFRPLWIIRREKIKRLARANCVQVRPVHGCLLYATQLKQWHTVHLDSEHHQTLEYTGPQLEVLLRL